MNKIEEKAINTIRFLAMDAVEKANSGHPGMPMGAAPMAYVLWSQFLNHSPNNPEWINRDRFVLSAGHGSMLLYGLLHLFGYPLSIDELKKFRQWGSLTPGHPEYGHTVGVETTTGPLGQGFANAVGMAIAEKRLASQFNRMNYPIIDHYTFVLAGDGDLMEGISAEAASLAGHLGLNKLICLYDDNHITIDGSTSLAFTEDVGRRFEAYGWQVLQVEDGNDLNKIMQALQIAKASTEQPTLIKIRTQIGYGSPNRQGTSEAHGAPLGGQEILRTRENLNWPYEAFEVPLEVKHHFEGLKKQLEEKHGIWAELMVSYQSNYPDLAQELEQWMKLALPQDISQIECLWNLPEKPAATRVLGGEILNRIAKEVPNLIGGSADLNPSTKTYLKGMGEIQKGSFSGNNIFFGIREHAMGGILNGMALHGGLRPFGSTFLIFSDYMKPAIRLAALMKLPVIYIFTHDSIGVGEDGPTHQPIEQLITLRSIPNVRVLRPADQIETAIAWIEALRHKEGPTVLVLSRQNVPVLTETSQGAIKGGYIISREEGEKPDLIFIATGSEVSLALEASKQMRKKGIDGRVVSMMSWEIFKYQSKAYQEQVLPPEVKKRISIEAGSTMGWHQFITSEGTAVGIDHFGASAPAEILMKRFGINLENIIDQAWNLLK